MNRLVCFPIPFFTESDGALALSLAMIYMGKGVDQEKNVETGALFKIDLQSKYAQTNTARCSSTTTASRESSLVSPNCHDNIAWC